MCPSPHATGAGAATAVAEAATAPDVFISYARQDRPVAKWLAETLAREGWTVWWDSDLVAGQEFGEAIRDRLAAAKCVIVIWSKASVDRIWVRAEARAGLDSGRLVPVSVGEVRPPLPFGELQTIDLTGWHGDPADPALRDLVRALAPRLGRRDDAPEAPLPGVDTRRFSVVVARIRNDIGQQLQDVIATDLSGFEGVHAVTLDREIVAEGPSLEDGTRAAEATARHFLDSMGGTVMIWGKVLRFGGREVPQLHLTVARSQNRQHGRYVPTDELRLPQVFWSDLADILRLVILTYDAAFRDQEGIYLADQLEPFVSRVRRLLERADHARGWSDEARGLTRLNLGDALMLMGSQNGRNEPLREAIDHYRQAMTGLSRERAPADWARVQNGLGICYWILGSRHGDAALLRDSVASYRLALEVRDREREPLDWAQTHNDLANVLATLGEQEAGTELLKEAVAAYELALEERTLKAKPLDWAQTKNNLGVALWRLGQREGGTARLREAVAALEASLRVYSRERTPLDWSQTQNNLGLVLCTLGQTTGSTDHLAAAVGAFWAALGQRRRARVPLLWAQTQNNIGLAFLAIGQLTSNRRRLWQAVHTFRRALGERTRERAPMDWAQTQNNLGAAYWSLGRESDQTEELEKAVQAYRDALKVYTCEEGFAQEWAQTQHNLGNALATFGERERDIGRLEEARQCLRAALENYSRETDRMLWVQTQADLGYATHILGRFRKDPQLLTEAANVYLEVGAVCEAAGLAREAAAVERKVASLQQLIESLDGDEANSILDT